MYRNLSLAARPGIQEQNSLDHLADAVDVVAAALAACGTATLRTELPAARNIADEDGTVRTGSTATVTTTELSRAAGRNAENGNGNKGESLDQVHGDEYSKVLKQG